MSATGYLVWFVLMAIATVAVLVLGFGWMVRLERKGGGKREPARDAAKEAKELTPLG
jgi:hypothetical protein